MSRSRSYGEGYYAKYHQFRHFFHVHGKRERGEKRGSAKRDRRPDEKEEKKRRERRLTMTAAPPIGPFYASAVDLMSAI